MNPRKNMACVIHSTSNSYTHVFVCFVLFFNWKRTFGKPFYEGGRELEEVKNLGQKLPWAPLNLSYFPSWTHRLHFPDSLAGKCDHVTRLWPMDVSISYMHHFGPYKPLQWDLPFSFPSCWLNGENSSKGMEEGGDTRWKEPGSLDNCKERSL